MEMEEMEEQRVQELLQVYIAMEEGVDQAGQVQLVVLELVVAVLMEIMEHPRLVETEEDLVDMEVVHQEEEVEDLGEETGEI